MVYDKFKSMGANEILAFINEHKFLNEVNCFDYEKAIKIIKTNNIKNASWGLDGDWSASHCKCLENGKAINNNHSYLNSTWAIPTLINDDTGEEYSCYVIKNKNDDDYETRHAWNETELEEINQEDYQVTLDDV